MVKNTEQQEYLDRIKWSVSNKEQVDMSGKMGYCGFCKYAVNSSIYPVNGSCTVSQEERVKNSYCAKAFNKMKRGGAKNA